MLLLEYVQDVIGPGGFFLAVLVLLALNRVSTTRPVLLRNMLKISEDCLCLCVFTSETHSRTLVLPYFSHSASMGNLQAAKNSLGSQCHATIP